MVTGNSDDPRKVLVCHCSDTGSIDFHNDERDTVVVVGGKVYDLVLSVRTFNELVDMPAEERPHVRHLNRIPVRNAAEQKAQNDSSLSKTFDEAKKISSEKAAKEYAVKKAKIVKTKPTRGDQNMAKTSKIKEVIEALQHKALTEAQILAMGIAKGTLQVQKYQWKSDKSLYTVTEGALANGEKTYKLSAKAGAKAPAAAKPALATA